MTGNELILIAIGLSMDAFAVALCKGVCLRNFRFKQAGKIGLFFGGFQAGMPLIGWILGRQFSTFIKGFDNWVILIILSLIGGKTLFEAIKGEEKDDNCDCYLHHRELLGLSLATSIDALAIGITFSLVDTNVFSASFIIGIVTLLITIAGVYIGKLFGVKYKRKAEAVGGIFLIAIGLKIFLESFVS